MCYEHVIIVYVLSIILGHILISRIIGHCWRLLEQDWNDLPNDKKANKTFIDQTNNKAEIKAYLGMAEIFLYITSIVFFGHPEWIGAWLTFKLAISWKSFDQNKIYSSHNIFLLGNALTIIVSLIGAALIKGSAGCLF